MTDAEPLPVPCPACGHLSTLAGPRPCAACGCVIPQTAEAPFPKPMHATQVVEVSRDDKTEGLAMAGCLIGVLLPVGGILLLGPDGFGIGLAVAFVLIVMLIIGHLVGDNGKATTSPDIASGITEHPAEDPHVPPPHARPTS